ncbi:MAG: hypothetical protein R3Y53_05120 [Bacillota bacterium]
MKYKVCSFFGHKTILSKVEAELLQHIRHAIETLNVQEFYVGEYGAFDFLAKKCVVECRKEFPHIKLYLALAYMPTKNTLIGKDYDGSIFFDGLESGPKRFAITKRNRIIAKESDVIICYVEKKSGGAYTAVNHAKNQGKLILNCVDNEIF